MSVFSLSVTLRGGGVIPFLQCHAVYMNVRPNSLQRNTSNVQCTVHSETARKIMVGSTFKHR